MSNVLPGFRRRSNSGHRHSSVGQSAGDEFEFDDNNHHDDYYYGAQSLQPQPPAPNSNLHCTAKDQLQPSDNDNGVACGGGASDTDEASESELNNTAVGRNARDTHAVSIAEPIEIKEQMYQDKLASLRRQLAELRHGNHPEYVRRVRKLEAQYRERLRLNEIYRDYLMECVERDYGNEKRAAGKEYDEKQADLKENLLTDFEDKRKMIETERHTMELAGDTQDVKPTVTRKLRRRPNDPVPVAAEKRRKPTAGQLVLLLEEKEVDADLKMISRGKLAPGMLMAATAISTGKGGSVATGANGQQQQQVETRIEDGKLLYERRWYHRGQPVYVEGKDMPKFAGTVSAIGNEVVWVKKLLDNSKVKINTFHLSRGKIAIKRRAN